MTLADYASFFFVGGGGLYFVKAVESSVQGLLNWIKG